MANFRASVRTKLRDIDGLVISCGRDDIEEDINNPGFARRWRNRAPGIPSQPQYRQPGDVVSYAGGRFDDFMQLVAPRQPQIVLTGGGQKRVKFNRASQQYFDFSIPATLSAAARGLTCAFQFYKGADTSNNQTMFDDGLGQNNLGIVRRNGSGRPRVSVGGSGLVGPFLIDFPDGEQVVYGDGNLTIDWRVQNAAYFNTGAAGNSAQFVPGAGFLGRSLSGDYLDGTFDSFHIWTRVLSPLERDFVWQLLSEDGTAFNTDARATMTTRLWTDVTGDLAQEQINRLRSTIGADPHYKFASIINGGAPARRVQIAAAVDGLVVPDTELGGDLFSLDWIEVPGGPPQYPPVMQTPGWSAVFDCLVKTTGHHTAVVRRQNGGSVILHFDAEVTP